MFEEVIDTVLNPRLHITTTRVFNKSVYLFARLNLGDDFVAMKRPDPSRCVPSVMTTLDNYNKDILSAKTGHDTVQILQKTVDIDAPRTDIAVPESDDPVAMQFKCESLYLKELPYIVSTANAIKVDRGTYIEAFVWDYLSKPASLERIAAAPWPEFAADDRSLRLRN